MELELIPPVHLPTFSTFPNASAKRVGTFPLTWFYLSHRLLRVGGRTKIMLCVTRGDEKINGNVIHPQSFGSFIILTQV